ncbi:hypothetical protein [Brevibacillus laterosporus]|uniref:Uncharacterized protein n=1 Tax=Brevibacillus laterosporus TaxID=1465 RepID=A0AAP8QF73_BRELA|nr:hypothetical protein [Brevibacillus laterosporus]PPA84184.1 hypothetical protein C4A76_18285 [Brevibacillus laterosporus]PPB08816.1 hypothetical protein C4A77_05875 [Brevibacillus laterosporus]
MPFDHLNFEELQRLWNRIHKSLTEPFPNGTIQFRDPKEQKGAYIPSRVYIHRLNESVGSLWSWRITNEFIVKEANKIQVNGVLKILHREHEGIGFHDLRFYKDNPEKISNYEDAKRSAANRALSNACDQLEMGWEDLAPYRDWSDNPGIGIENKQSTKDKICVVCQKTLTNVDEEALKYYGIRNRYCEVHIPEHMTRKKEKFNPNNL